MWNYQYLPRMDFRIIFIALILMGASLLVISSYSGNHGHAIEMADDSWMTPIVKSQIRWFVMGWGLFFLTAAFDYSKLREWTWILYTLMILSLVGLFFTDSIQRVHRWYKVPGLGFNLQPSELAKLIVVITLSWFLERRKSSAGSLSTACYAGIIVGIPFLLILKQPDLGTALVLFPITMVLFYYGDVHPWVLKTLMIIGGVVLFIVALIFLNIVPHETMKPYATVFLKEYQFDRLDPATHHQKAASTAIAIGGIMGNGWRKSFYTGGGWLPAPYTDSVFPAFGDEFGLLGLVFLLVLYYALIYCSFQVTAVAKDAFGRFLSSGIAVYLAMHIIVNIGMMSGILPITGVPLILVTYGGSSTLSTMIALGILQSIYSRRFMF
jgi:rod shape determining protein RodA